MNALVQNVVVELAEKFETGCKRTINEKLKGTVALEKLEYELSAIFPL
jgi:hypothetical protein